MAGTEVAATDDVTENGVPLTVAEADGVPRGGIVVLHEARGVTELVLRLVGTLAEDGWLAVAPHLYHRETGEPDVEQDDADAQVASLTGDTVLADCDAAVAWLARRGVSADRVGVFGFDTGGTAALVVAASRSLGAAVSVSAAGIREPLSAGLPALLDVAPDLGCPWLGLYGEADPAIPSEHVEALRRAAATSDVATDVVTYPGVGHRVGEGALEAEGSESSTTDALARVLGWFDSHLR
jgi:carboxymethylenebutenolidase